MPLPRAIYTSPRPRLGSTLVLTLVLSCFTCVFASPFLGVPSTLGAVAIVVIVTLYLRWLAGFRVVSYDGNARALVVEWRGLLFQARRQVFPVSRFASVISFYPWGKNSQNWVYVMETVGDAGVPVASFELNYQYRSFWDLLPKITESEGARELRLKIASSLSLEDKGFAGLRTHPKIAE